MYNASKKWEHYMNKSTIFLIFVIFLQTLYAGTSSITTQEFPKEQYKKQKTEIASMVAKEISSTLPQKVDKYTTLVDVKNENSTLVYTFEINSGAKSDEAIIKEDHSRMQRAITEGVCQSSSKFLEAGINTRYIYIGAKTKKRLFVFDITQDKCLNLK
jgi:hypothetical protein